MTTTEEVTAALEKAIATKGEDYTYHPDGGNCRYTTEDGAPSCIVGWVVAEVNPPLLDALFHFEQTGNMMSAHELDEPAKYIEFPDAQTRLDVDKRTLNALQAAQSVQDDGYPWAEAKRAYEAVLAGKAWLNVVTEIESSYEEKEEQQ